MSDICLLDLHFDVLEYIFKLLPIYYIKKLKATSSFKKYDEKERILFFLNNELYKVDKPLLEFAKIIKSKYSNFYDLLEKNRSGHLISMRKFLNNTDAFKDKTIQVIFKSPDRKGQPLEITGLASYGTHTVVNYLFNLNISKEVCICCDVIAMINKALNEIYDEKNYTATQIKNEKVYLHTEMGIFLKYENYRILPGSLRVLD